MNELKTELVELIAKVGEMVRADERYVAVEKAAEAYAKDPEIATALTEYNVQQAALAEAFGAEERDEALVSSIQNRINALYTKLSQRLSMVKSSMQSQVRDLHHVQVIAPVAAVATNIFQSKS